MFFAECLRSRFRSVKNDALSSGVTFWYKNLLKLSVAALALTGLYAFLTQMFGFAEARQIGHGFRFAGTFLSFSLFMLMPLIFFGAIISALDMLFDRKDLSLFFASPTPSVNIFILKFWNILTNASWASALLIATFVAAIQRFFGLSILVYPVALLGGAAFVVIPVSIGVAAVLILSALFPFYRAKEVLTAAGLFVAALMVAMLRFLRPERLVTADGKMVMLKFMDNVYTPRLTSYPNELLTNICAGFYRSAPGVAAENLRALLVAAAASLGLAIFTGFRLYARCADRAWSSSLPRQRHPAPLSALRRLFPERLILLAQKDMLHIYRDAVQRSSLLILIIVCAVYFYNIYAIPIEDVFSSFFRLLYNYFLAGLVVAALGARWVFASISSEGQNFKLFRSSPMSAEEFLRHRFILGFVPLLILAEFLTAVSSVIMRLDAALFAFSVLNVAMITYTITAMGLHLGALLADFGSSDPLVFLQGYNGLAYIVACALYVLTVLFLEALPVALYMSGEWGYLSAGEWVLAAASCLGVIAFSIACARYPHKISKRYLISRDIPNL